METIVHVGCVEAGDTRMALILAKECFFRREHPSDIWVARREDLHPLLETELLDRARTRPIARLRHTPASPRSAER